MPLTHTALYNKVLSIAIRLIDHRQQQMPNGESYLSHLFLVADKTTSMYAKALAIGHDLLEDHPESKEILLGNDVPESFVELLEILNKNNYPTRAAYLRACTQNVFTREVKLADIHTNLNPLTLGRELTERDLPRLNQYIRDYDYLTNYIEKERT